MWGKHGDFDIVFLASKLSDHACEKVIFAGGTEIRLLQTNDGNKNLISHLTQYVNVAPQHGDRIVIIDYVT